MLLQINTVELVLRSDSRLQVIYDEGYELSFESSKGLQIAINRKSTVKAIRLWIQNTIDPRVIERERARPAIRSECLDVQEREVLNQKFLLQGVLVREIFGAVEKEPAMTCADADHR